MDFYEETSNSRSNNFYSSPGGYGMPDYSQQGFYNPNEYMPAAGYYGESYFQNTAASCEEEFEPPLLEELGVDVFLIRKRVLSILDPFSSGVAMGSYDIAGPLFICMAFAIISCLTGSKINFNQVYFLSAFSCIFMYGLLSLMVPSNEITFTSVTSILGYNLLPVVLLSFVSVFYNLYTLLGMVLSVFAVLWCTFNATKMFAGIGSCSGNRLLIAYPCVLCYGVFTICVLFK